MVYERFRVRTERGIRSFVLENPRPGTMLGSPVTVGYQVNREGIRDGTFHIIDGSAVIVRIPLVMDLHYGELTEQLEVKRNNA